MSKQQFYKIAKTCKASIRERERERVNNSRQFSNLIKALLFSSAFNCKKNV